MAFDSNYKDKSTHKNNTCYNIIEYHITSNNKSGGSAERGGRLLGKELLYMRAPLILST
jgi:hypothetical protein